MVARRPSALPQSTPILPPSPSQSTYRHQQRDASACVTLPIAQLRRPFHGWSSSTSSSHPTLRPRRTQSHKPSVCLWGTPGSASTNNHTGSPRRFLLGLPRIKPLRIPITPSRSCFGVVLSRRGKPPTTGPKTPREQARLRLATGLLNCPATPLILYQGWTIGLARPLPILTLLRSRPKPHSFSLTVSGPRTLSFKSWTINHNFPTATPSVDGSPRNRPRATTTPALQVVSMVALTPNLCRANAAPRV